MIFRLSILIVCIFLSSCSSIRKYKVIPVDSTPRGIDVYDDDKTLIGETPFFYQIDPSWYHDFYLKQQNNKFSELDYNCKIDWLQSILPASIVSVIPVVGPFLGIGLIGMDFAKGGIYKCHRPLTFKKKDNSSRESVKQKIKRILILPPNVPDESFSNEIVSRWNKNLFEKFNINKFKDELISFEKSSKYLRFNGVDHLKKTTPMQLRPKVLRKIGLDFEVTHILYFDIIDTGDEYKVKPYLTDAFNNKKVKEKYLESFTIKKPESLKETLLSTIVQSISFLPNSANVRYVAKPGIDFTDKEDGSVYSAEIGSAHPRALPRFLSVLSLDSVDHPQFYSPWDVSLKVSPSFGASSWKSSFGGYNINLLTYNAVYNLNVNFHTSFGALGIGVGYGLAYLIADDSLGKEISKFTSVVKANVNYVAFFNDRYYFKFNFDAFSQHSELDSSKYGLKGWSETSVGIGYYFPELKSVIRGWLPF